jgi:hypothetical protein
MVCLEVMKFNVVSFHSGSLVLFATRMPLFFAGSTVRCYCFVRSETSCSCLKVMSYYSICTICLCLAYQNYLRTALIGCFA